MSGNVKINNSVLRRIILKKTVTEADVTTMMTVTISQMKVKQLAVSLSLDVSNVVFFNNNNVLLG